MTVKEHIISNHNSPSIQYISISSALKKEFFRKTIHMLSAFVPFFYYFSQKAVMIILLLVTLLYFISEILKSKGIHIPVIYMITEIAARERDQGKIILGPITLSMGIFLALTFFDYRIAIIAIFALSFGDGVASLFGKIIGGWKMPLTLGKTLSGSLGCFLVLLIVYLACSLSFYQAIFLALIASLIEMFPLGDFDNLLIPVATGLIADKIFL